MSFNPETAKGELVNTLGAENPSPEPEENSAALSTDVVDVGPEVEAEIVDDNDNVGDFRMLPSGLFFVPPSAENKDDESAKIWISAPFKVRALASDVQKNDPHLLITFDVDDKKGKEAMVSTALLHSRKDLARTFEGRGLAVAPTNKGEEFLCEYLSLMRPRVPHDIVIAYSCGWQVGDVFMLPNGIRCGDNKELVRPSSELEGGLVEQSTSGTMRGQKQAMKLACNNPWFQFCACVALAGPLVKPTNSRSVGFHVWSKSSRGKSIAAELAASIWQKPDPLQNWRSTANALEGLALRHNDGFMVLDEIQTVVNADALDEASYLLANGKQKTRLNADSTLKKIGSWNIAYLSTGEYSYATALKRKSGNKIQQAQSGQEVRLISIHAPETDMGLVSDFAAHGLGSSKEYVEKIQELARGNYGHIAGAYAKMLAEAVQNDPEGFRAWCSKTMDAWKAATQSGGNQVNRIVDSIALVACAGKLATDMGLLPWGENDAFEACWMAYKVFLEDRGSGIDGEDLKILEAIHCAVQTQSHRFAARSQALNEVKDCLGRLVMSADAQEILFYDFTSEGLQEICKCKIERILDALKPQEWLVLNDKGENQHKTTIKKEQWRFYRIRHDKVRDFEALPDGEDAAEGDKPDPEPSDASPETASEQIPLDLS